MWNDDFHHAAKVALTGTRDGYFGDYTGRAQEFISCVRHGFLYQGQWYPWQKTAARLSRAPGLPACSCIVFLQNHDQVGNTFLGDRVHANAAPGRYRALMALTLLGAADADAVHGPGVRRLDALHVLRRPSRRSSRRWCTRVGANSSASSARTRTRRRSSSSRRRTTKRRSSTRSSTGAKRSTTRTLLAFHRDLLQLRACDPVISHQDVRRSTAPRCRSTRSCCAGSTTSTAIACCVVNLDRELPLTPPSEPLLAPPRGATWQLLWSSEDPRYGGHGVTMPVADAGRGEWRLPAQSAVLLVEARRDVSRPMRIRGDPGAADRAALGSRPRSAGAAPSRMADHERPRRLRLRHARRNSDAQVSRPVRAEPGGAEGPAHHDLALR